MRFISEKIANPRLGQAYAKSWFAFLPVIIHYENYIETAWLERVYVIMQYQMEPPYFNRCAYCHLYFWRAVRFITKEEYSWRKFGHICDMLLNIEKEYLAKIKKASMPPSPPPVKKDEFYDIQMQNNLPERLPAEGGGSNDGVYTDRGSST